MWKKTLEKGLLFVTGEKLESVLSVWAFLGVFWLIWMLLMDVTFTGELLYESLSF